MVDPSRHADSRGMVESILRKIPGFRGYLEKEYRRESDYLARSWLADQINQCKAGLDRYQRSLLDAGQIDHLDDCERVRTRLDTLRSRIEGAVRGYSGFFDFVQVDEDVLDDVYDQDMSLAEQVDGLAESIEALSAGSQDPPLALSNLLQRVEELHRAFDRRSELLEGLGPAE